MGCIELCRGIHTTQRQTSSQISIGYCSDCIGLGLGVRVRVGQCEHTITENIDNIGICVIFSVFLQVRLPFVAKIIILISILI